MKIIFFKKTTIYNNMKFNTFNAQWQQILFDRQKSVPKFRTKF